MQFETPGALQTVHKLKCEYEDIFLSCLTVKNKVKVSFVKNVHQLVDFIYDISKTLM